MAQGLDSEPKDNSQEGLAPAEREGEYVGNGEEGGLVPRVREVPNRRKDQANDVQGQAGDEETLVDCEEALIEQYDRHPRLLLPRWSRL